MDSPRCIRSKALFMSSSGIVWVMRSSMLILPSMYQSTIFGTSVRPLAPPKALPPQTRPATRWTRRAGPRPPPTPEAWPPPAAPGAELDRAGGDLLPRPGHPDDHRDAPAPVGALERL